MTTDLDATWKKLLTGLSAQPLSEYTARDREGITTLIHMIRYQNQKAAGTFIPEKGESPDNAEELLGDYINLVFSKVG